MIEPIAISILRLGEYLLRFGWPGAILAFTQRRRLKCGGPDPVAIQVPGIGPVYMRPSSSDLATFREIFVNGEYDFERHGLGSILRVAYERMLDEGRQPVILDAGANIGLASLYLNCHFPKAQFVLVEANRGSAAVARRNMPKHGNWEIHESALWDQSGQINLIDSSDESTYAVGELKDSPSSCTVQAQTLGEILGNRVSDLLIVKMDIEGAEHRIFPYSPEFGDWLNNGPLVMVEPHDGIFNPSGSLSGLLCRPRYRDGMIIPNGSTILFLPERFALLAD